MKSPSKLLFPALILLLLTGFFDPVSAQTSIINAEHFDVEIWPEYDRSAVLVIYKIQLSTDVKLPAQISLRIPSAGSPPYKLVYYLENNDRPYPLEFRTYSEDNWSRVVFNTPTDHFQLEYYDGQLDFSTSARAYTFEWPGDISCTDLTVSVQKPALATDLVLPTRFSNLVLQNDGLYYATAALGQMDAGNTFSISIQYIKENSRPTYVRQSVKPIAPISRNAAGRFNLYNFLPAILSAIIVLGIFIFFMVVGLRRIAVSLQAEPQFPESDGLNNPVQMTKAVISAVYCPVCGSRSASGDNFCRVCGSPVSG